MRPGRYLSGFCIAAAMVCAAEQAPLVQAPLAVAHGCFVESVALRAAGQEKAGAEAWAKRLRWGAKEADAVVAGHAVAVRERQGR